MSKLSDLYKVISDLKLFRQAMAGVLDAQRVIRVWGDTPEVQQIIQQLELPKKSEPSYICSEKLRIAREGLAGFSHIPIIKFIGVSGSVAAGTARSEDDIDLFIIASDHSSWIVRLIMKLMLRNNAVWFGQEDQRDRFCINLIVEERAMRFPNQDIFTFHELIYLEPISGSLSKDDLLSANSDLFRRFHSDKYTDHRGTVGVKWLNLIYFPFDMLAFLLQLIYMAIFGHEPEFNRLIRGWINGRIEFYPSNFRVDRLREFEERRSTKKLNDKMHR